MLKPVEQNGILDTVGIKYYFYTNTSSLGMFFLK